MLSSLDLQLGRDALAAGGVVACPTEAVWGLSCDPWDERAVMRLLELKRRPVSKGLILVAATESQLQFLLQHLSPEQRGQLSAGWPGPVTWLIPHRGRIPPWISGDHDTVAVRVSGHPVVNALCAAWGGPLVSSSANRAGAQAPRAAFQVRRYFGERLDYILAGAVGGSARPSVIRDLASGRILRP
ncbi:MAG: Sua5/YciO/YrdC/YwlC family protein [Pseudomonadales bacterium]|nr:Sua5/YciO/YrdC/YwlC family protein [Pseudomonadales bacterium]MCP5166118.1 Sua5/YciO/YrdC/YwlC family protein [Pseudomonadales bacterium]MCP5187199.1 Sua5/YciO/YrdC/YwlC family protein [Pseudomonadales bacterium]